MLTIPCVIIVICSLQSNYAENLQLRKTKHTGMTITRPKDRIMTAHNVCNEHRIEIEKHR